MDQLRGWQRRLVLELSKEPNDGPVVWIYDVVGGLGKTWMTEYLVRNHAAIIFDCKTPYKMIARKYNGERIVIFDNCGQEFRDMGQTLHNLKSGCLSPICGKPSWFKPPHVICFSRQYPLTKALSDWRWSIRELKSSNPILQVAIWNENDEE